MVEGWTNECKMSQRSGPPTPLARLESLSSHQHHHKLPASSSQKTPFGPSESSKEKTIFGPRSQLPRPMLAEEEHISSTSMEAKYADDRSIEARVEAPSAISRSESGTKAVATKNDHCLPDNFTHISTLTCTKNGLHFVSKANDFILNIPEGAILASDGVRIDVGVALFGPFQYPKGLRPVSLVFWVGVQNQPLFFSLKPVRLTIPHFLNLESDSKSDLVFLKAGHKTGKHDLYEFEQADGKNYFESSENTGVLETTHFCSLCIACTDKPSCLASAKFCITSVLPRRAIIDKKQYAYFFITFYNLKTCLAMVDKWIKDNHLEHYEKTQEEFHFKRFTLNPALEIVITQPEHGMIGLMGKKSILRKQVDFFAREGTSLEDVQIKEQKDRYPPRFNLFFVSTADDVTLKGSKIRFKGARSELPYSIYLEPPGILPQSPTLSDDYSTCETLDIRRDVSTAKKNLKDLNLRELKDLFQELGLHYSKVQNPTGSVQDVAEELIRAWIRGDDDVLEKEE